MVFVTLKKVSFEHDRAAKDLHCYVDEVFEFAMDMEVIEDKTCPAKKEFIKLRRKVEQYGAITASHLTELYQFVMDGKSDPTSNGVAITLIVSAIQVTNSAKNITIQQRASLRSRRRETMTID